MTQRRREATYGEAKVVAALNAYVRRGSLKAAEAETGVPWETIREWRKHPRWASRLDEIRHAHAQEVESLWLAAARDAAEGLQEAILRCRRGLRRESLSDRDAALIGRTLASVLSATHRLREDTAQETTPPLVVKLYRGVGIGPDGPVGAVEEET